MHKQGHKEYFLLENDRCVCNTDRNKRQKALLFDTFVKETAVNKLFVHRSNKQSEYISR